MLKYFFLLTRNVYEGEEKYQNIFGICQQLYRSLYRFISLCFISKDIKYKFCIVLGCLAKISKKTCLFFF